MEMIVFACPACGATFKIKEADTYCKCEFCGSISTLKDSLQKNAETDALVMRAYLLLEDSNFQKADQYFEKILDIDPHCSMAYIGKLLCQLGFRAIDNLACSKMLLSSYDYYNKAVRFASEKERDKYEQLAAAVTAKYDQEVLAHEQEISKLESSIVSQNEYLEKNKGDYYKSVAKKTFWRVLFVISICSVIFWTVGTIVALPLAIIAIPCIVLMIFVIRKNKKMKSLTEAYDKTKQSLAGMNTVLLYKKRSYENLLMMKK